MRLGCRWRTADKPDRDGHGSDRRASLGLHPLTGRGGQGGQRRGAGEVKALQHQAKEAIVGTAPGLIKRDTDAGGMTVGGNQVTREMSKLSQQQEREDDGSEPAACDAAGAQA